MQLSIFHSLSTFRQMKTYLASNSRGCELEAPSASPPAPEASANIRPPRASEFNSIDRVPTTLIALSPSGFTLMELKRIA
jgi:hypothetical protein